MLHRPWFTPIVVVFWCVTSGWLLVEKILPSLAPGSPPGYQAIYTSDSGLIPVAWTVHWNDQPLGWAIAESQRTPLGGLVVDSRMHFDRLPLDEILPAWTSLLVRKALPQGGGLTFDARGRLAIDPAGDLRSFMSVVNVPGSTEQVLLNGTVDAGAVRVQVQTGEIRYETTWHLPDRMMIGDELSPQATMPGLFEGRRWTVPIYSPLRAGGSPIEILHAEVGPEETIYWEGRLVRVHPVAYREDPASRREPRSRLWADRTGRVLRQEALLLGAKLAFVRRSDEAAARLAATLAEEGRVPSAQPPSMEAVP
ncbi:MAG: hypothetical protein LW698_11970 [Planctomycetaceae bacterium]|nr:hypothetical protein [Planctomycetaceae bacterium]